MSDLLPDIELTHRGFERIDFHDANGAECSIQQSSAVGPYDDAFDRPGTSFLWLGENDPVPKVLVQNKGWVPVPLPPGAIVSGRMHLSREHVRELIPLLQKWLETGSMK